MFERIRFWLLKIILKRALIFEEDEKAIFGRLKELCRKPLSCRGLDHIIQEEERHKQVLRDIAQGRVTVEGMERILEQHHFHEIEKIEPLAKEVLSDSREELLEALQMEEGRLEFYRSLAARSKIPAVKRAFQVLADMEGEHLEILRKLSGSR